MTQQTIVEVTVIAAAISLPIPEHCELVRWRFSRIVNTWWQAWPSAEDMANRLS